MKISLALGRFAAEAARAVRNFKYEKSDTGIFLPGSNLTIGGVFGHALSPAGTAGFEDMVHDHNMLVDEGLIYILNAAFGGQSQIAAGYIAPFSGNVTPASSWTGANYASQSTEFTSYTGTRLPWTVATATTPSIGNTAALAASTMTFSAGGPYNVYGLGLLEASAKGATTGKLVAATRFTNPRLNMVAGDRLALEYVITASNVA